jgi:hypothetical protein
LFANFALPPNHIIQQIPPYRFDPFYFPSFFSPPATVNEPMRAGRSLELVLPAESYVVAGHGRRCHYARDGAPRGQWL